MIRLVVVAWYVAVAYGSSHSNCTVGNTWVKNKIKFECYQDGMTKGNRAIACVSSSGDKTAGQKFTDANFEYTCLQNGTHGMKYTISACKVPEDPKVRIAIFDEHREGTRIYKCDRRSGGTITRTQRVSHTCTDSNGTQIDQYRTIVRNNVQFRCQVSGNKASFHASGCVDNGKVVYINSALKKGGSDWEICLQTANGSAQMKKMPNQACVDAKGKSWKPHSMRVEGGIYYRCIIQGLKWTAKAYYCVVKNGNSTRYIGNNQFRKVAREWKYCDIQKRQAITLGKVGEFGCNVSGKIVDVYQRVVEDGVEYSCRARGDGSTYLKMNGCLYHGVRPRIITRDKIYEVQSGVAVTCKKEKGKWFTYKLSVSEYIKWKKSRIPAGISGSDGGESGGSEIITTTTAKTKPPTEPTREPTTQRTTKQPTDPPTDLPPTEPPTSDQSTPPADQIVEPVEANSCDDVHPACHQLQDACISQEELASTYQAGREEDYGTEDSIDGDHEELSRKRRRSGNPFKSKSWSKDSESSSNLGSRISSMKHPKSGRRHMLGELENEESGNIKFEMNWKGYHPDGIASPFAGSGCGCTEHRCCAQHSHRCSSSRWHSRLVITTACPRTCGSCQFAPEQGTSTVKKMGEHFNKNALEGQNKYIRPVKGY